MILSFLPMHKFACHVYTTAEVYFVKGIFAIELTFFEGDIFFNWHFLGRIFGLTICLGGIFGLIIF